MSERVTQAMFATIDGYGREPNDRQVTLGFRTVDEASAFLSFISEVKHTWTAHAARPASAEKIASVVRAWPWPEQRAQLEAMLVRTEAYTTPPAAAQDRERWRPEVRAMADAMEAKLRKHDAARGESWKTTDIDWLLNGLDDEVAELRGAVEDGERVLYEAASVANFAMMIADRRRALNAARAAGATDGN